MMGVHRTVGFRFCIASAADVALGLGGGNACCCCVDVVGGGGGELWMI